MKLGRTLEEVAQEVLRQGETKRDFVAPAKAVRMREPENGGPVVLTLADQAQFGITATGHEQLATWTDIPRKYYDRMATEAPALLAKNVNCWLTKSESTRLVRTLDGNARAFRSDKYRRLDYFDLMKAALPVLHEKKLEIVSCEVTERRLYIKAVDKSVIREVAGARTLSDGSDIPYGVVSPAVVISDSEIGDGSLSIEPGTMSHRCKNMHIFRFAAMKKYHVGARAEMTEEFYAMLSDTTRQVTDAGIWLQFADVLRGSFDVPTFEQRLLPLAEATQNRITGDVVKVVDVTASKFKLSETEKAAVLTNLIQGGDLSQFGLFNAVTRAAEDVESYDRATALERIGGDIVELGKTDFARIAAAVSEGSN